MTDLQQLRLDRAALRDRVRTMGEWRAWARANHVPEAQAKEILREAERKLSELNDQIADLERAANMRRALRNDRQRARLGAPHDAHELLERARQALIVYSKGGTPRDVNLLLRDLAHWIASQQGAET